MKLTHGIWLAILSAGFMGACSDSSSDDKLKRENQNLATQNAQLQSELDAANAPLELADLEQRVAALKNDTMNKEAEIEAQRAEIEVLKLSGDANAAAKIKSLEDKVSESVAAIDDQKALLSRLEIATSEKADDLATLFRGSISPYAGIWLLDPRPELSFANCQYMVRFDAEEGSIYRATLCEDGKIQAEVQSVTGFAAKNSAGWNGTVGFNMDAKTRKSSCGEGPSFFASGLSYGFDHSMGTTTAANEAALFMSASFGEDVKSFKSGSSIPDLGKNKSCGNIITRSKLGSQAQNLLLQQAAKVCQLSRDLQLPASVPLQAGNLGCFKAADQFEPLAGANP
jgi:hypothetical protein